MYYTCMCVCVNKPKPDITQQRTCVGLIDFRSRWPIDSVENGKFQLILPPNGARRTTCTYPLFITNQ